MSAWDGDAWGPNRPRVEPSADTRAASHAAHELYVGLTDAGFPHQAAMEIVIGLIARAAKGGE